MEVIWTCGRMNPPTIGHERLVNEVRRVADERKADAKVFLTKTQDGERNPLSPDAKKDFVERAFAVSTQLTTSPYSALEELLEEGATKLTFIVGEDRMNKFTPLIRYAAEKGVVLEIKTISRTENEASATQARQAVLEGDLQTFVDLVPSPHEGFADELYQAVRRSLGAR